MINKKLSMEDFNKKLQKLKDALSFYDNLQYANKKFTYTLANGEKIAYNIPENAIPHLLGVDTTYLFGTSFLTAKSNSSIDILRELCKEDNWYYLYSRYSDGSLDLNQLLSNQFEQKIDVFVENIKPMLQNVEFVCKIDRNKIHQQGKDYMDIDYVICSRDEQGRYLILGLVLMGKYYTGRTSMVFDDLESLKNKLKEVLHDQQMTFAYSFSMYSFYETNTFKPVSLKSDIKNTKVKGLVRYKDIFSTNVDITQDYLFTAAQNDNQYAISREITECMKRGEIISLEDFGMRYRFLPESLKIIIDQYNDLLCHGGNLEASVKYSEVDEENRKLKEKIDMEKTNNEFLTGENAELRKRIEKLEQERDKLLELKEDVSKLYTKHFK